MGAPSRRASHGPHGRLLFGVIPRDVAAAFHASVRSRGDEYFAQGRVRVRRADAYEINAIVRGSAPYRVRIAAEKNVLTASCGCPFAEDHGICKHIWATLRAADQSQQLQLLTRTSGKNPGFVAISDESEGFETDESVDDDLWADATTDLDAEWDPPIRHNWSPPPRSDSRRPQPNHHRAHRASRPPVWKTLIERAATEMAVGATKLLTVEACVAVTGAAGPDPLDGAPPGTVVIATAIDGVTSAATYTFPGSADIVRHRAAEAALRHLGYQLQAAVRR